MWHVTRSWWHKLFIVLGFHARPVQPFPVQWYRDPHVCITVVPDSVYCQVSFTDGLLYHGSLPVSCKWISRVWCVDNEGKGCHSSGSYLWSGILFFQQVPHFFPPDVCTNFCSQKRVHDCGLQWFMTLLTTMLLLSCMAAYDRPLPLSC